MPAIKPATEATFLGVKNGRPRFDIGDTVPPKWLLKLASAGKVVDGEFLSGGKPLVPGQVITGRDDG